MRLLLFSLFLLMTPAPVLAAPAHAQVPEDCARPAPPPVALVEELTRWIGDQTDYDISQTLEDPPDISFCDTGDVITYEGHDLLVDETLRAAYDLSDRHIFLVAPWQADNPEHVSALLHELIHDVQLLNRKWDCLGAPEWEAYKLQEKWLAERGIDPGFDWLRIFFLSRCPRDIHPD